jgi:hypothetical protein
MSSRSKNNAAKSKKSSIVIIKCICGFELLLVPDVKKMSDAIEAHLEEHKQKIRNSKASEAETERIRDYLITQVFEEASKQI